MKLRNKKTGEIGEIRYENHALYVDTKGGFTYWLRTIAKLNDEWEDVPAEPLIKDEKIREAVRAWAEANRDVSEVIYEYDTSKAYCEIIDNQSEARIRFNFLFIPNKIKKVVQICTT